MCVFMIHIYPVRTYIYAYGTYIYVFRPMEETVTKKPSFFRKIIFDRTHLSILLFSLHWSASSAI